MRNPDPGKASRPRRMITLLLCSVLVAACGKDAISTTSAEVITTPTPPAVAVADETAAPEPTAEQITAYVAALNQAEAWDFVAKWWWADLAQFVEAMEWAQAHQEVAPKLAPPAPSRAAAPQSRAVGATFGGGTAPNGFLSCVRNRESRGNYGAVNSSSGAGGAYQFLPSTWRAMGGSGLPQNASPAEQDRMAAKLYAQAGPAPWAGPGC
jgi:hypothetical protein